MQPFIESLPPAVEAKLHGAKPPEEKVLIQVATDVADDQTYGEAWLVASKLRLLVIPADGAVEQILLDAIQDARTEELVGGGRLVVERKSGAPVYLHYSSSLIPKFAEVAQAIGQLAKGKPLELPTEMERTRCEKCGRLLPEKDSRCVACIKKWNTLMRIQSYVRPYRTQLALVVSITVIGVLINLMPPLITERIIDDVLVPQSNFNLLAWLVAGLLGAYILSWLCEIGHTALSCWLGFRAAEDIRAELYRCLQFLPIRFYDKHKVGSLISRMTNDADRLEDFVAHEVPYVISNALLLVGIFILLLYKNWVLTLYVLLPVPPIVLGGIFMWNRLTRYWRLWSTKWSRFSSHLNESITGIRLVKAFAQEDRESTVFDRHNDELRQVNVAGNRAWFAFYTITNFLMSFGAFFVWYFGGKQVLGGDFKLGELTAFISFLWMLYQPLRWFGDSYNFMLRAFAGAERIFEVMDSPSEPFKNSNAVDMPKIDGRLTFKDVTFGYDPGKPVLRDINLTVEPGEMIGLVGKSGVGKSTMANLICRFYDVTHGTLQVDNEDIRNIPYRRFTVSNRHCPTGAISVQSDHCGKHPLRQT